MCVTMHVWRSEDNLQESVLSFQHVVSGALTQIVRLGSKHLCPLSYLTSPYYIVLISLPNIKIACGQHLFTVGTCRDR